MNIGLVARVEFHKNLVKTRLYNCFAHNVWLDEDIKAQALVLGAFERLLNSDLKLDPGKLRGYMNSYDYICEQVLGIEVRAKSLYELYEDLEEMEKKQEK